MNMEKKVIEELVQLANQHEAGMDELKLLASEKGFIYAIVDNEGRVHATRKTFGAANRILGKGTFSTLSTALADKENLRKMYRVITVHLSQIKECIEAS